MPGSRRVTILFHVPMSHAALLPRRHPLQIPPPQFRGSCQCVGSLVSYKVLSVPRAEVPMTCRCLFFKSNGACESHGVTEQI